MRSLAALAAASAVCAASSLARAQVSLSTDVSPRRVEAGQRFVVRLKAMSEDAERPSDPRLELPPGLTASGPSVGSQSQMSIVNGRISQTAGISATWSVIAERPGKYRIGPASVQTSRGRAQDRPVTVEVVPQGSLPQAPPPLAGQPLDPWDLLRGMRGSPFPGFPGFPDLDEPEEDVQLPQLPQEYRIERPLDPIAFLRTRAQPRKVVIGEQVTLSIYAYAGRGNFEPDVSSEPSHDDFLAFNLMDPGSRIEGYQFDLNGQRWLTAKVRDFALFPLKTGKLKAGAMSYGFIGRNYSRDPRGLKREAQPIEITVVEPPLAGRPPGYRVGDVGHYGLSAEVEPREVVAGGSISVVAKLEGTGNLPISLLVPEQKGVRWLEPQIVDQVGPRAGVVQGFRTFTYVVELSQPGERDLGELTLPYWDPKAQAYGVARASLGTVNVTGSAPAAASADKADAGGKLTRLLQPPKKLGPAETARGSYVTNRSGYWALLLGLPLLALGGFALSDLARLVARRLAARRGSLSAALDDALSQLSRAGGSPEQSASAAERALFIAIEKATGVKARGVLKSQLPSTLTEAGLPAELAQKSSHLLSRCDELRFAGAQAELESFVRDVRDVCQRLGALQRRKSEPGRS